MNYDLKMQDIIKSLTYKPKLLLHSCCGPCSTAVIERLINHFMITVFYYNPNIEPVTEYEKRKQEQIRYLKEIKTVKFLDCDYDNDSFIKITKNLENEFEGGARCTKCFNLRLEKTLLTAKENNFEYFGTTLTVSPYKNSRLINEIGEALQNKYNCKFLFADFKKHDGYKRSVEIAKNYNLYRQEYCGCRYSLKESIENKK